MLIQFQGLTEKSDTYEGISSVEIRRTGLYNFASKIRIRYSPSFLNRLSL